MKIMSKIKVGYAYSLVLGSVRLRSEISVGTS